MTLNELKIQSEETAELNAALAKAQGAFKPLEKSGANKFQGYSYATITDINNATREALSANGLSITSHKIPVERGEGIRPYLVTTIWHDSGQWLRSFIAVPGLEPGKGNTQLQEDGLELTYLVKYNLRMLLNLAPEEDTDGADAGEKKDKQPEKGNTPPPAKKRPEKAQSAPKEGDNGKQTDTMKSVRATATKLGIDLKEYFKVDSSNEVMKEQWADAQKILSDAKFEAVKAAAKMAIKFEDLVEFVNTSEWSWEEATEKFKSGDLDKVKADIEGFLAVGKDVDEPVDGELAGVGVRLEGPDSIQGSNRPE